MASLDSVPRGRIEAERGCWIVVNHGDGTCWTVNDRCNGRVFNQQFFDTFEEAKVVLDKLTA